MNEVANVLSLAVLREAVKKGAALRCRTRLQPDGGDGGKVFPPTYAGGVYAVEDRRIGDDVVRCVLLDSVQSQANRMEEALQDAFLPNWRELPTDGEEPVDLPVVAVNVPDKEGQPRWVTSLTAPHRIHDAILRDSEIEETKDGQKQTTRFRASVIGKAVAGSRLWNATAFYRYCPTALLFGTWDSTAGEGLDSAKIPRAVVSEIIGVDITPGIRTASRIDPLGIERTAATIYRRKDGDWAAKITDENGAERLIGAQSEDELEAGTSGPKKFGSDGKPSDINHGNIIPHLPRFDPRKDVQKQHLDQLDDVLRGEAVELRCDIRSRDGEMRSYSAVRGQPIKGHAVKPGGITMAYALHTWTLSLTQFRRLRFPSLDDQSKKLGQNAAERVEKQGQRDEAARMVLAAVALYALALLQDRDYWLRSRCELLPEKDFILELLGGSTAPRPFTLGSSKDVREKLLDPAIKEAREKHGLEWERKVIRLTPTQKLLDLVRASEARRPEEAPEEEEAAGAGSES